MVLCPRSTYRSQARGQLCHTQRQKRAMGVHSIYTFTSWLNYRKKAFWGNMLTVSDRQFTSPIVDNKRRPAMCLTPNSLGEEQQRSFEDDEVLISDRFQLPPLPNHIDSMENKQNKEKQHQHSHQRHHPKQSRTERAYVPRLFSSKLFCSWVDGEVALNRYSPKIRLGHPESEGSHSLKVTRMTTICFVSPTFIPWLSRGRDQENPGHMFPRLPSQRSRGSCSRACRWSGHASAELRFQPPRQWLPCPEHPSWDLYRAMSRRTGKR